MPKITKTFRVRVKDKHASRLNVMKRSVNFIFNQLNEVSSRRIRNNRQWLTWIDAVKWASGASKLLPWFFGNKGRLCSGTIEQICRRYIRSRDQFKKHRLRWRKTYGARRTLGWIPLKANTFHYRNGQIHHYGDVFSIIPGNYDLAKHKDNFKNACFSEDSRGRWYLNIAVEVDSMPSKGTEFVGIDLGCKDAATCSSGPALKGRRYRELESALGKAQRARKKDRVRAIHAKVKNRRKDDIHKFTRRLVRRSAGIAVGNVASRAMVKTNLAKSVYDAGWGAVKTTLGYKCAGAGVVFEVVNEAFSTQTCSRCGTIPDSSPKGRAGLGIREWACSECKAQHRRDINAAKNILAATRGRLVEGRAEYARASL